MNVLGVPAAILSSAFTADGSLIVAGPLAMRRPVIRNANRARNPAPRFMDPSPQTLVKIHNLEHKRSGKALESPGHSSDAIRPIHLCTKTACRFTAGRIVSCLEGT